MDGISTPRSLSNADSILNLAEALQKLLDSGERKKISDDVKAHHALNDTEAKKAEDARALIKQHQDILNEANRIALQNKKDADSLTQEKVSFKAEIDAERAKLAISKGEALEALEKAQALHSMTVDMQNLVNTKENELRKQKDEHLAEVKKLSDDRIALEKERSDLANYKKQVIALDNETKAKVEKLKQFNF